MQRVELQNHLDTLLECGRFHDYCPNGLQVEGRPVIQRVICGVTASLELIQHAVDAHADAVIVHHGWFWRGEEQRVTGIRRKRLGLLLAHDINLFGFHLPLDAHPDLGNNAGLGRLMGWCAEGTASAQPLIWLGHPEHAISAGEVARMIAARLAREPLLVGDPRRLVRKVAWCTGGAQGYFEQAIEAEADLFVSGEISEQTVHLARESGIPYIAAGHHATERYGIQALSAHLHEVCGLDSSFLDLDNPV